MKKSVAPVTPDLRSGCQKVGIFTYLFGHFTDSKKDRREEEALERAKRRSGALRGVAKKRLPWHRLIVSQIRNSTTREA